ncbi:MAG: glycosyl transferase group 1 [Solirubrobacterales bacterium]|nr:glycosyl transferase group 1 [Solirubrobacterales bacterium]
MPRLAVVKYHDYGAWRAEHAAGRAAGGLGPYGIDSLASHGFTIAYSDRAWRRPWAWPVVLRPLRKLARLRPELSGLRETLASRREVRGADVVLGIFEDHGMFAAFARAHSLPGLAPRAVALIACWLAEDCQDFDRRTLAAYRRALAAVERLFCFSENQRAVFEEVFGVDPARIHVVPFGIDAGFFRPEEGPEEDYVLAIGRDRGRDPRVLVEAMGRSGGRLRLFAPPGSVDEGTLPANVELTTAPVDHVRYREILARARVVAVTTTAPRYPSGQTVVLEAMAMGKPVVVTDSPAMRDYVVPDVHGVLVPPSDPGALARAIDELLGDGERRRRLGRAGRAAVEARFNQDAMWAQIAAGLRSLD